MNLFDPGCEKCSLAKAEIAMLRDRLAKKGLQAVELPAELDCPEMQAAWSDWIAYRKEIKKPMGMVAQRRMIPLLERLGPVLSIKEIDRAINGGWMGLHPAEQQQPAQYQHPEGTVTDPDEVRRRMAGR